ncbi:hypothetical protein GAH_01515 [Geoglobus ahangari]|uniref:Uncharacterized protein n=1 Tax=Geoglobus ahangari TaxID=113653 RepID=A0A0F7ID25_9EURY|nr:hypothetical protein [Geoglobus ahangari]AKG91195.1 hypothetical protein GAH_01515 [Geoglobus ahangari]
MGLKEKTENEKSLIDSLYEHTKKVTPYLTVYSAIMTMGAIFLAISEPLKSTNQSIAATFGISGLIFVFSSFIGILASIIYIYRRGRLLGLLRIFVDGLIIGTFILFFFGFFILFFLF